MNQHSYPFNFVSNGLGTWNGGITGTFECTIVTRTPLYEIDGCWLEVPPNVLMKIIDGKLTLVRIFCPHEDREVYLDEPSLELVRLQAKFRGNEMLRYLK